MKTITCEIVQVGGGSLTSMEDAAIYLIHVDGHAALVDAGCGKAHDRLMENIAGQGIYPDQVELLLLTHCHFDHTGGAAAIKRTCSCTIVAHEADAFFLEAGNDSVTAASWYGASLEPLEVDRKLTGPASEIYLGKKMIQAIHVPGHSPGSLVFFTESDGMRVLFGQDVHGPLDASLLSNKDDYLKSLEMMLDLNADILCEGHFGIIRGKENVRTFIQSYLKYNRF